MKKLFLAVMAAFAMFAASAQVMQSKGFKNTVWTGMGAPLSGDFAYYGALDTFQVRCDVDNFIIEGMLTAGVLADYDGSTHGFHFGFSDMNPLRFQFGNSNNTNDTVGPDGQRYSNSFNVTNVKMDPMYVNFLWTFKKYFQLGIGTKLNWQVGPAPGYGGWLWEDTSHVRQGGFSTTYDDRSGAADDLPHFFNGRGTFKYTPDRPGSSDVVGFVPYANKYAKTAVAFRFKTDKVLKGMEIGGAIPQMFDFSEPAINVGFRLDITDWIAVAASTEGTFHKYTNFYTGATLKFSRFILNAFFAADAVFAGSDHQAYATGANATFKIGSRKQFQFTPEVGFNFFANGNYTPAWFTDLNFDWGITEIFGFGAFGSIAFGSRDTRWDNSDATKDWYGGFVFDVRPMVYFNINKTMRLSFYASYEHRNAFDKTARNCFSTGAFFSCKW